MADRPFVYVCSPLRGDYEANMERAREYSRRVFEAGYCPITPHIYFPQFLKDDIPAEREAGMRMGESLLPLCRMLVICGDMISEGMKQEIIAAQKLGIETCTLENIPPIPTLDGFRNDLSNLDNFGIRPHDFTKDTPSKASEKPSVLKKITAAREQATDKLKRKRQPKGKERSEEH